MLTWYNGVSIFGVILFLFVFMLILKCCNDSRRNVKIKRRSLYGNSFQDIPQTVRRNPTAPPRVARSTTIDYPTEIDGIAVMPDSNTASPVVVPPYPVEPRHPTPHVMPSGPGFATHNPPYPTHTPHPTPGAAPYPPVGGHSPYPPITGATPYPPSAAPYPPTGPPVGSSAPYPDYSAQPPSYSEAVAQPSLPVKDGYTKQAPYNPNY